MRLGKRDIAERGIVNALRDAGIFVYQLDQPVDLLCHFRGEWKLLEVKTPGNEKRRSATQKVFIATFNVPVVWTVEQALAVFGLRVP